MPAVGVVTFKVRGVGGFISIFYTAAFFWLVSVLHHCRSFRRKIVASFRPRQKELAKDVLSFRALFSCTRWVFFFLPTSLFVLHSFVLSVSLCFCIKHINSFTFSTSPSSSCLRHSGVIASAAALITIRFLSHRSHSSRSHRMNLLSCCSNTGHCLLSFLKVKASLEAFLLNIVTTVR